MNIQVEEFRLKVSGAQNFRSNGAHVDRRRDQCFKLETQLIKHSDSMTCRASSDKSSSLVSALFRANLWTFRGDRNEM